VQISSPPSAASATASKAEPPAEAPRPTAGLSAAPNAAPGGAPPHSGRKPGSISRRLLLLAAAWILALLGLGGVALDRIVTGTITRNFDTQLAAALPAMIAAAELDPFGEVRFNRPPVDPRFNEPYSGLYWQVAAEGRMPFRSRSLWDRELPADFAVSCVEPCALRTNAFRNEPLRVVERDGIIPGSPVVWRFQVAQARASLDAQIETLRATIVKSFAVLALGLIAMVALQTLYGLWPLRRLQVAIAEMRAGRARRIEARTLPSEVEPLVVELNGLLEHDEKQAEEAREHAGNLAHALKTPLTVIMNAATASAPDLNETVIREAATMRRQVDHHLARARAIGRRGHAHSRTGIWPSLQSVERAVARLYPDVRIDIAGDKDLAARIERQDLDEILGNLIENAAKYGGGSVFITVQKAGDAAELLIEDDGAGIAAPDRDRLFNRGVRLDSSKPGTGLGLAIVRDVAELYNGTVVLEQSEDLGGLLARLRLPLAA
jgi:signal transduction histidine kinase